MKYFLGDSKISKFRVFYTVWKLWRCSIAIFCKNFEKITFSRNICQKRVNFTFSTLWSNLSKLQFCILHGTFVNLIWCKSYCNRFFFICEQIAWKYFCFSPLESFVCSSSGLYFWSISGLKYKWKRWDSPAMT